MTDRRLSQRAHDMAALMHNGDTRAGPPPTIETFEHLDAAPEPTPPEPADWDTAAFDRLPVEHRAAIIAGTAHVIGQAAVRLEAEQTMVRPDDVDIHIADPARYVNRKGVVDHDAIRHDIAELLADRPELAAHRPDTRRRPAEGHAHGQGAGPVPSYNKQHVLDLMARGT